MAGGRARYDEVADSYETGHPDVYDSEPDVSLLQLVGPVDGLAVLDLACGHGRFARELARRGALVVGSDLSGELLAKARTAERRNPLVIDYVQGDAASPHLLDGRTFDVVVSSFGLSDIDDLDGALATVTRLLRPGGSFAFSILHPCFPGNSPIVSASWPPGAGYVAEGWWCSEASLSTLRRRVGANHRALSSYVNSLIRHGLSIEVMAEPQPPHGWSDSVQLSEAVPVYLVVRCKSKASP